MRGVSMLLAAGLLVAGCGQDAPEEDQVACGSYEESVDAAERGDEAGMMAALDEAASEAGSDRMFDLVDELLAGMEQGEGVDEGTVNSIRSWCGLE